MLTIDAVVTLVVAMTERDYLRVILPPAAAGATMVYSDAAMTLATAEATA